MKRQFKLIVVALCTAAMIFGIAGSVVAAEAGDVDLQTVYQMAQKALDQQAIQNVMSRHVMYHCYGLHEDEVVNLWVNEPENRATASFGQNQGYMVGWQAIWDGYVVSHDSSWLSSAKSYCERNGIDVSGMTDEEILDMYGGVGQFLMHFTTTQIIEVAADGKTAKCFWYSPGMVQETGGNASSIWEAYCVDMVKEGNDWKIWHLHMYTDFTGSFFVDLGGAADSSGDSGNGEAAGEAPAGDSAEGESAEGESAEGESPEGEAPADAAPADGESAEGESAEGEAPADAAPAEGESDGESSGDSADSSSGDATDAEEAAFEGGEAEAMKANDYLWSTTYQQYSKDRLRSDMELVIPVPYDTWSFDEPNYGPTKEEWESYGVDLDAWYAAHAS